MWGRKKEPGDYCVAHVPKFPDLWEFVTSLYFSITDDVKWVSERLFATMVVSVSCSSEFFYELWRWFVLHSIKARTIKPAAEDRAEASNSHDLRWKGCLRLFVNWLRQKYLVSDTAFPLWPQAWPGWWQEEKWCHHCVSSHRSDVRSGEESEEKWCPGCDHLLWLMREQCCGQRIPCNEE